MWNRRDIKRRGRASFRRNYWAAAAICFLLAFVGAEYSESATLIHQNQDSATASSVSSIEAILDDTIFADIPLLSNAIHGLYGMIPETSGWIVTALRGGLFFASSALMLLFSVVVLNPLMVGARRFFLVNEIERASPFDLLFPFQWKRFWNTVKVMFFRDIYKILWTMLLIVPGIVKSYEYRMIPFLLADNPTLDRRTAFALSKAMMTGNKWRTFVLDLSFLPWMILVMLSFGILGIFYVNPYIGATEAALYIRLKTALCNDGAVPYGALPLRFPAEEVLHETSR